MSLIKIFKAPSKLFKKDVITFITIRRHDLGVLDNKLHYIAVKPTASISVLRQKVWHLLNLPDYCDEIIKLESEDGKELPLTELRTGNNPQHPYILEVWLPGNQSYISGSHNINMLTMGDSSILDRKISNGSEFEEKIHNDNKAKSNGTTISQNTVAIKTRNENKVNTLPSNTKTEVTSRISSTSLFYKLHGRKSRDNFTNILLKIQSDLILLSNKLTILENKIQI